MIANFSSSLLVGLSLLVSPIFAQQSIKELPSGYYMTVAAYLSTGEDYAIRYTNKLLAQGHTADYGYTYKKNMYFVYIKKYDNYKIAISEINSSRKNPGFEEAWVYVYTASNTAKVISGENIENDRKETEEKKEEVPVKEIIANNDRTPLPATDSAMVNEAVDSVANEEIKTLEKVIDDGSRKLLFETVDARTYEQLNIDFTIYDPIDKQVMTTIKSWNTERVKPPKNDVNIARVTTNTFGWKKDEFSFNFENPVNDSTNTFAKMYGDTLILFFEMQRLRPGDVQTLFNVYFFNESSIMHPDSKFQLEELLAMMQENPDYRIKLHGHTNGSAGGNYTRLAADDTIFFKMTSNHERTNGKASALSYDRALTVKQYLIAHGINEERMEVKGWGGKKMIYDKNSTFAKRNIRVEVEILKE